MMKINKNKINFGLQILSILAFSLLLMPIETFATPGYVDNPTPYITSISPDYKTINMGTDIVITITGNGFIPSSIARVNGSDRVTTFIDYSHILVRLYPNDTYNSDGFYINVFNGFPGGGYSNAEYFTINRPVPIVNAYNNNQSSTITRTATTVTNTNNNVVDNTYSNTTRTENTTNSNSNNSENNVNDNDDSNNTASNLAATAIFGSNSFLPSGLIQWILFAILILLIIIFVRRIFGARQNYEETPLKHA